MAQQPNVEIDVAERPRPTPEPSAADSWRPDRPGEATGSRVDTGGTFGHTGPNSGYALKLVRAAEYPETGRDKEVEAVVAAVAGARGAHFGRGPVMGDVVVGLALLGLVGEDPETLAGGRDRVLDGTAHEHAKGLTFVASVPADVLYGSVADARRHAASELG